MMKSAIDWLMGKTDESLSLNDDLAQAPNTIGMEQEATNGDRDSSKENSAIVNGHFSGESQTKSISLSSPVEKCRRSGGEEIRSPWGRTLTPKSPKFGSPAGPKQPASLSRLNSTHGNITRISPSVSWEEMNFTSDVMSPGFASRIAKEVRGGRKIYDGSRKYPIGQEKYIRSGVLPNVRLKGGSKPVVMPRRATTSPLLPIASSSSSPFSSSSLASGFLSSVSTRMPDISSVVSVLDSTPSTSALETISDPTSVHAVVAALEQTKSLKSGIKRSRFGEAEDSNKKQKCIVNSNTLDINNISTPIMSKAFSSGGGGGGLGGGEKRALDLSPPSNGADGASDRPQLSPENKRRCIPDPRIASLSSSKNISHPTMLSQSSGRETPFSIYESHQDSDSESNKSLDSHQSRQSERSFKGQNHDSLGRASNQDQFDRSGSQTPLSLPGSYGIGVNNGSNSSSRTTTPSRPSHMYSHEAYKAEKAKTPQRLNKMLGMLFNVSADEGQPVTQVSASSGLPISGPILINNIPVSVVSSSSTQSSALSTALLTPPTTGLLKEAFATVQSDLPKATEQKAVEKEASTPEQADVSTTFTFTLKPTKPTDEVHVNEESEKSPLNATSSKPNAPPPPYSQPVASTSSPPPYHSPETPITSLNPSASNLVDNPVSLTEQKPDSILTPSTTSAPSNPLEALKTTTVSINKSPLFSFGASQPSSSTTSIPSFSLGKANFSSAGPTTITTTSVSTENTASIPSVLSTTVSTSSKTANPGLTSNMKTSNLFSFGTKTVSSPGPAVTSISAADTGPKPSLGIIVPTLPSYPNKVHIPVSSSGLFNFAVGSSNFNAKDKEAEALKTSQSLPTSSPFSFGKSLPDGSTSVAPTTNLFTFGSSRALTTSSNSPTVNMNTPSPVPSETTNKVPNPSEGGFSFAPSSSGAQVSTSSSVFNNTNLFTFGSSSDKAATVASTVPQTSGVSAASGIFSFGDPAKTTAQPTTASFQFGSPVTTSSTNPTPAFGGSIGGGFSFGGAKTTTTSSAVQFGSITSTNSTSSTFSFNTVAPKQSAGFQFSAPKTSAPTSSSGGIFTFGGSTNPASSFGAPATSAPTGFGSSTPSKAPNFSFVPDNKTSIASPFGAQSPAPAPPTFGAQSPSPAPPTFGAQSPAPGQPTFGSQSLAPAPPTFGSTDIGSKTASGSLFGGVESTSSTFGAASNASSPFGMTQTQNLFAPKSPSQPFGPFVIPKSTVNTTPANPASDPNPKQSPFQMGQSANQSSSAFTFGQPNQNIQSGVFMFGSQGAAPSVTAAPVAPAPNFGGGFNFSGNSTTTTNNNNNNNNNNMGRVGTNLFTVGASSDTPTAARRHKARPHRRR